MVARPSDSGDDQEVNVSHLGGCGHPRMARYMRDFDTLVFSVAGCFEAVVTEREARELPTSSHFDRLVMERIVPFIWLAMPGHEDFPKVVVAG